MSQPEVEAQERLEILIAMTDAYQTTEKFHEPNLSADQIYEKCRHDAEDDLDSYLYHRDVSRFKAFMDAFEAEIGAQEFAIDEAEWMSLIQALRVAEQTVMKLQT